MKENEERKKEKFTHVDVFRRENIRMTACNSNMVQKYSSAMNCLSLATAATSAE